QANDEPTPGYFVFRVKTDLQRELAPNKADYFVFLDTTDILKDSHIDPGKLNIDELRKDLRREKNAHKDGDAKLHFSLFFNRTGAIGSDEEAHELLKFALIGLGYDSGFSKV